MRSVIRTVIALVALVVSLAWGGPAKAHATVALTVHTDGRGSVAVDVAWADGHPITETVAATMTAVSAAARVGPVALTRLPGRPTVVYSGTLAHGTWQVTVDTALPGIGHCEAVVEVGAQAPPGSTRCGASPAPADQSPGAAPAPNPPGRPLVPALALVGAGICAGVVALLAYRRTRRRPARR